MFASVRRCISNVLAGLSGSNRGANGGNNIVLLTGVRKLTRTGNATGVGGGLKAALTTALLFIMGTLYCLYGTGNSTTRTVTPLGYGQQSLGVSDAVGVQADLVAVAAMVHEGTAQAVGGCNNSKKHRKKPRPKLKPSNGGHGVLTAADMYEPGFRIRNSGLCTERTQLLVLITSAAAPSHSQHRQAIRMTWMNRYGPSVTMGFLVGTPQMSETDPVAQLLEAEEKALRIRLNNVNVKHNDKPNEKAKSKSSAATADADVNSRWYRFSRDREPHLGEGLDAHSMRGLNEAERAVQRVLGREHSRYGDLVQCHSRDTYTNLTLKSIAALEWTREFCPSARYLLKTDDDMFIDVRRLLRFIDKVETDAAVAITGVTGLHPIDLINEDTNELFSAGEDKYESSLSPSYDIELPPTIWGRLAHGWRPIRQHNSKYYVSRSQFAGRVYPDFCTGPAYLMTRSAVSPLYEGALGRDFYMMDEDEDDEQYDDDNEIDKKNLNKDCGDSNETLVNADGEKLEAAAAMTNIIDTGKNTVPYLKLEDVYLTGVVAERLTQQATERQARRERKDKEKISSGDGKYSQKTSAVKTDHRQLHTGNKNKLRADDIIVKVRRIHSDQFANKKITGRALERAVCSGVSSGDNSAAGGSGGFSWFHWYWGDTTVDKDPKKKKKDQGVISLHMVKYYEQFDLWRRLMDGRTKCKP
ncbi:Glycosyl transferase, family 31 [Cinara cedri]|uniref:Glycosyl transferase, family 31 n=1 Tax=Cinara cedri TaxID=506608 RepID=A0A5E4MC03_9HEMI|nr:Glycosyl transferase, family 31 [Cinara cedri]